MRIYLLIFLIISSFFSNYCGCFQKCSKDKNKNTTKFEDEGVFNDKINIKQQKIEKTTLNIKEKFNKDEIETFKKIADKDSELDKNENIKIDEGNIKIDEKKFKDLKKILKNKEENKTINEKEKQLLDKLNNIKEENIEKTKEVLLIPFIDNKENLSFVTKKQIIDTVESAYDESIKEEDKILKKNIIEAINVLDKEIEKDNAKDKIKKESLKFDSKSSDNLYIFGIRIYEGNWVNYIYDKLFDFNNGENCYQIKMIEKEKNGSENSDIKCQNLTDKVQIFNFTFHKTTTKKAKDYVSFVPDSFKINTTHNVNNDFYLKNKDNNNFMLYVDSDAMFDGNFTWSPSAINVYTDILYCCFYDEKNKCTFFFTINFARYNLGNIASVFNWGLKTFKSEEEPKNDIEKKRLEILKNQGIYILEIKEQNDENVKEIYNELENDPTLNKAFESIKSKVENSKNK